MVLLAASIFSETARCETTLPSLREKCNVYSIDNRLRALLSWLTCPRTSPQEILRSRRFADNYGQCAIEGFPADSYAGMLTSLGELAIDYRWSTRYIFLEG